MCGLRQSPSSILRMRCHCKCNVCAERQMNLDKESVPAEEVVLRRKTHALLNSAFVESQNRSRTANLVNRANGLRAAIPSERAANDRAQNAQREHPGFRNGSYPCTKIGRSRAAVNLHQCPCSTGVFLPEIVQTASGDWWVIEQQTCVISNSKVGKRHGPSKAVRNSN